MENIIYKTVLRLLAVAAVLFGFLLGFTVGQRHTAPSTTCSPTAQVWCVNSNG